MAFERVVGFAGHQIRRCHQIAVALFNEELAGVEVTPLQYAALSAIADHEDLDATRLAKLVAFDRSTLGSVLERLEKRALIERRYRTGDRRTKQLAITAAGRRLLDEIAPAVARSQARFIDVLDARERDQLGRVLGKLIALHAADEARLEGR
jgi:MarR family transcriptional regulator, lower aerobic nicotinate degradation pathway regulator